MTDTVREHAARWELDDRATHNTPGPTYQSLLDHDRYPIPALLRWRAPWIEDLPVTIPKSRYLSHDVAQLEAERLWTRVWQVACREEHLPTVGDSVIYEVADRQYIVVRSDEATIRCFPNVCLHRGRQLRDGDGHVARLRCPFHGFTWNLDGSIAQIPTQWDFPHVDREDLQLPEAQVGAWGGFVWINPDPNAAPLEDFIADFPRHFERFPPDDWYTQAHSATVLNCNWKLAVEAFIEASHVYATHPQSITGNDPCNSQYDMWDHFVRIITPVGVPSVMLRGVPSEQAKLDAMMGRTSRQRVVEVPSGQTARLLFADIQRRRLAQAGNTVELCDSELVDLQTFWVFPNFLILGGARGLYARFRPKGIDPGQCIMELAILAPPRRDGNPPPAEVHWVGPDDLWSDDPAMADYALFDQDLYNLRVMQQGLQNAPDRPVLLSRYQEAPIAYFHELLGRWLTQD